MNTKWTGRKLLGFLIILILTTSFFVADKISSDQWINIIMWLFGIFVTGNVVSKFGRSNG